MYETDDIDEAIEEAKKMEVVNNLPENKRGEKVTITLEEYVELRIARNDLALLVRTLIDNATYCDYTKGNIRYDSETTTFILSLMAEADLNEAKEKLGIEVENGSV